MFNRRLVEKEIEDWIIESWRRLHGRLGPERSIVLASIALPKPGVFGAPADCDEATGSMIFETVKHLAGLESWPVELESFESLQPDQVSEYVFLSPEQSQPAGLFTSGESNVPIIRYDIGQVRRPMDLVATFAHELAHYLLLATGLDTGEMGEEAELLTDLGAVYMGFGVFQANSAFEFSGHQGFTGTGWASRRQGYLSENSLLLATALFVRITGTDPDEVEPYLKDRLRKNWKKAIRQIDGRAADIDDIIATDEAFRKDRKTF